MPLLAEKMRPNLATQKLLVGAAAKHWNYELKQWREGRKFHVIFWGPPGCGKTTLAKLLAESTGVEATFLSAVNHGVRDIREAAAAHPGGVFVIDEIHRLSSSQQDVLLPILEESSAWLVGTTTESPRVALSAPVLSRVRLVQVKPPSIAELIHSLHNALDFLQNENITHDNSSRLENIKSIIIPRIAAMSQGDLRFSLNFLEAIFFTESVADEEELFKNTLKAFATSDHYDNISAMIKSLRGSDPDAALYYAIRALDAGEDPLFIMRRCVIFAAEDIGNADPQAIILAQSILDVVKNTGLPECAIPIAQCITYLASTQKSNRSYMALSKVREWIKRVSDVPNAKKEPPAFLTKKGSSSYVYPHDCENAFVNKEYLPIAANEIRNSTGPAYVPSDRGVEAKIKQRLQMLWPNIWK